MGASIEMGSEPSNLHPTSPDLASDRYDILVHYKHE